MKYRANHYEGVFSSQAMPGGFGYYGGSPLGFNPQPEPPTRLNYYRRGYGEAPPVEQGIPPIYLAYGALGIAGLALIVSLARG